MEDTNNEPVEAQFNSIGAAFKLIPRNLIPKLANEYGVSKKSRRFSPASHVLALMFGQLSHAISLNDICDCLRYHSGALSHIRESVAPSRNGFSNANRRKGCRYGRGLVLECSG